MEINTGSYIWLIGIIILSASYLIGRFVPGGFLLLALGIILILNSRE